MRISEAPLSQQANIRLTNNLGTRPMALNALYVVNGRLNSEIMRKAFTVFIQYSPEKTSSLLSFSPQCIMLVADFSLRTSKL